MKSQSFFYGWVIVAVAGLGIFFSGPGQTYSNSVYIDQYIQEFNWSRTEISSLYSIATLIAGLMMIFMGGFVNRFGQKKMMLIVGGMLGLACLFNSFITNMVMMAAGFFLIRLFGQGGMSLVPNTLVPQWFITKRGRAMSFMTIGSFASAASFPVINVWLIEQWSWQVSWQIWGALLLFFFLPVVIVFVRNKPEDIGLLPDGRTQPAPEEESKEQTYDFKDERSWTLKEAARTRTFWVLLICIGIPSLVNTGITFHLFSLLGEQGISPEMASLVLSLMAIIGFPMSLMTGFLVEKYQANTLLSWIFVIEIIILLLLMEVNSAFLAIVFSVIWGISNGLERITVNIVWPNYFGREYVGSLNGVGMTMIVIGSAFGPLPFGAGFDYFQSYVPVLLMMLVLPVIGIICALLAKNPQAQI